MPPVASAASPVDRSGHIVRPQQIRSVAGSARRGHHPCARPIAWLSPGNRIMRRSITSASYRATPAQPRPVRCATGMSGRRVCASSRRAGRPRRTRCAGPFAWRPMSCRARAAPSFRPAASSTKRGTGRCSTGPTSPEEGLIIRRHPAATAVRLARRGRQVRDAVEVIGQAGGRSTGPKRWRGTGGISSAVWVVRTRCRGHL